MSKKLLKRVPHEELNLPELFDHLEKDFVRVYFKKKTTGTFRNIYPFTLRADLLKPTEYRNLANINAQNYSMSLTYEEYSKKSYSIKDNQGVRVIAWSLLDNGWRSFYTENLLFYEVYDLEGDTL